IDQEALLFEQRRYAFRPKMGAGSQRTPQREAGFVEREPLQGARELVQVCVARIGYGDGRRSLRQLVAEEVDQLDHVGRPQLKIQEAALDLFRNGAHRRTDDDELTLIATALVEIAQAAPDFRRFAQGLVKVLQVEDGGA